MTNLNSTVQVVLQEAGYRTWLVTLDSLVPICFEDEAVMGFVCIFDDMASLINRWRAVETELLIRHAGFLREAGEKAWNVYSIFLCSVGSDETKQRQIRSIEEDLERTRKITACGLVGREDVVSALLPILPLQSRPIMERENVVDRLRKRIDTIAPVATAAILDLNTSPAAVVPLLQGKT